MPLWWNLAISSFGFLSISLSCLFRVTTLTLTSPLKNKIFHFRAKKLNQNYTMSFTTPFFIATISKYVCSCLNFRYSWASCTNVLYWTTTKCITIIKLCRKKCWFQSHSRHFALYEIYGSRRAKWTYFGLLFRIMAKIKSYGHNITRNGFLDP